MNYTIKSKLGEGGMATVHLAEDHKFHTEVALKMLNKEFVNNENIKKRFLAEARSMFRMSHPHVIRVSDLIDEGDTVAFVMEYVEGETLKEYLERKGKLTDTEIRDIFSQMLDAVGYVHEQKLVHRDIKPSNFMIDKSGKLKLMDFGIAKNTDVDAAEYTQTGTGMQMGTPMYMSPEQITETNSVTAQSDIYSLGVVLWQLVTGQKPYDTKTLSSFQLQNKIVTERLGATNTIWDKVIQKATAKDCLNRCKSCAELNQDIIAPRAFSVEDSDSTQIEVKRTEEVTEINLSESLQTKSEPNREKSIPDKGASKINKSNSATYIRIFLGVILCFLIALGVFFSINGTSIEEKISSVADNQEEVSVKIGNQVWMTGNLNVDKFRNGDPIPEAKTREEWIRAGKNKQPVWSQPNISPQFISSLDFDYDPIKWGEKYGKYYNWYAVNDPRGLAPVGWHVASDSEWIELTNYLGGETEAGQKMKSTNEWGYPDDMDTNQSGFSGLPGGTIDQKGQLYWGDGEWWTSSDYNNCSICLEEEIPYLAPHHGLGTYYGGNEIRRSHYRKEAGLYVRCIKD
jgi:uncharacterized protein (TIGR02145 family)